MQYKMLYFSPLNMPTIHLAKAQLMTRPGWEFGVRRWSWHVGWHPKIYPRDSMGNPFLNSEQVVEYPVLRLLFTGTCFILLKLPLNYFT